MATTEKIDALIRVSRKDGREGPSFRSPTQQREVCERWARENGAEIVNWHEGIGRSGKTMERADIDSVLARIQAGQTEGVVVAWINRFSRAPTDEALAICRKIEEAGGKFYPADLPGVNIGTPIGEFTLTMMLATARLQWAQTAERYNQTRREAIAEGKAIGGAPFGYRYTDPTPRTRGHGVLDSRLVPDLGRAPIVNELFERKAGGATWLELTRWLDEVAPKPNGGHWARSTVATIIRCRTYLGEVRSGEHVNAKAHEPIVSAALWRRAQNGAGRRTPRGTYLLSGSQAATP